MIKIVLLICAILFITSGCARALSVGEPESYCAEHGCNYSDDGVCASPREILEHKDDLSEIKKRNEEARKKNEEQNSIF